MKRKYGLLIIAIVTIIYGIDVYAVSYFPEKLQLKRYYDELQRQSMEIVKTVLPYVSKGCKLSYDLEKLFAISLE